MTLVGGKLTAKPRFVVFDLDLDELWQYVDLVRQGANTFAVITAKTGEAQQYRIEKQLYWAFPLGLLTEKAGAGVFELTELGRVFVNRWKHGPDTLTFLLELLYINACYDDVLLRLLVNFLFFPAMAKGRTSVPVQEALDWTIKQRNLLPSQDEATIRRQFSVRVSSLAPDAQTTPRSNFNPMLLLSRSEGELELVGHMPAPAAAAYCLLLWAERVARGRPDARIPTEKLYDSVGSPARLFLLRGPQFRAVLEKLYSRGWITLDRTGGLDQVGIAKLPDIGTIIGDVQ